MKGLVGGHDFCIIMAHVYRNRYVTHPERLVVYLRFSAESLLTNRKPNLTCGICKKYKMKHTPRILVVLKYETNKELLQIRSIFQYFDDTISSFLVKNDEIILSKYTLCFK